jgi:hypothetical protein
MLGNDIDNGVEPRVLFVFEGLVARPPSGSDVVKAKVAAKFGRWDTVLRQWELDSMATRQMWDLVSRRNMRFDVVTFTHGEGFAEAIAKRFDDLALPVTRVLYYADQQELARDLAFQPDVQRVFHADPRQSLMFGGRGRYVSNLSLDLLS